MITLDDHFASRLLDIGLNFMTKLISSRVSVLTRDRSAQLALTYLQPNHVANAGQESEGKKVHEVGELTIHMQVLRALQQQLIQKIQ